MRLYQRFLTPGQQSTRRDFNGLEERRRQAMALLTEGHSQVEVAHQLGVSEVSVCRWNKALRSGGEGAWQRKRLGKPPKVGADHLSAIRAFTSAGASLHGYPDDRWTYARIAAVLKTLTGLSIHQDHLCRIFHRQNWTLPGRRGQRPVEYGQSRVAVGVTAEPFPSR